MKCFQCGTDYSGNGVLVSADSDFACSPACHERYVRERDYFLNTVIHDDRLYERWLQGEDMPR